MQHEKFIVTKELGKLAKWLRILGYDTLYYKKNDQSDLIIQTLRDSRILLARSSLFTKYKGIKVVLLKSDYIEDQINQVVQELNLQPDDDQFFQRCIECNTFLEVIDKEAIKGKTPEYVFITQKEFKFCQGCGKIFWKGTHWNLVKEWLAKRRDKR